MCAVCNTRQHPTEINYYYEVALDFSRIAFEYMQLMQIVNSLEIFTLISYEIDIRWWEFTLRA